MSDSIDYSAMLDGIDGAAYVSDEEGRIVGWNSATEELLGYDKDVVVGRACHQIISGRDPSGHRFCRRACDLRELMRCGEFCTMQMVVRKARGDYLPVTCWAVALCAEFHYDSFQILHVLEPQRRQQESIPATGAVRDSESSSAAASSSADGGTIFTHRESEVLKLLADGRTTHEAATALSVSVAAVRTHTQTILHKLNAHTRMHVLTAARDERSTSW